jgi:hypothetical protein
VYNDRVCSIMSGALNALRENASCTCCLTAIVSISFLYKPCRHFSRQFPLHSVGVDCRAKTNMNTPAPTWVDVNHAVAGSTLSGMYVRKAQVSNVPYCSAFTYIRLSIYLFCNFNATCHRCGASKKYVTLSK